MYKYILGIQSYANHDSGASIIRYKKNKKAEYIAISEERLLRKKFPYTFPLLSIIYCMNHFNIKNINQINFLVSDWIRVKKWLRSGPAYNYKEFDYIKEKFKLDKKKIFQISHHLAHAASTYYSSNFKNSSILIVDGNGSDVETNSYFKGSGKKIKLIDNYKYHGIGNTYSAVTKNILNLGTGGEGKTMGLSSYGKKDRNIKIDYNFNGIKTNFSKFILRMPRSDMLNNQNKNFKTNFIKKKINQANKKNIMKKIYRNWAFEIQDVAEKTMIHLGKDIFKKVKSDNLCLAGGVALNCVANEKLFKKSKFKEMFIFPASSDSGVPFGLAAWGYHNLANEKKNISFENAYTGINYSNDEITELLSNNKIPFKKINEMQIAQLISEGKVIGNFNGASEYGPRALGNRSILGDARNSKMRDHINIKVKHREIFRPFAPAILEEKSKDYFDIDYSPFMLRASDCKKKNKIPSAIHVDGTARVQTVNKKQNKKFYNIINSFYKITGVPVILNTSFNDAGEPLVETPLDAIICFLKTDIDCLVLNNFLIEKKYIYNEKIELYNKLEMLRKKLIQKNLNFAIKKLTKSYSIKEFKNRKKIEHKKAKELILNKPIYQIKNYFKKFKLKDKVLIIGTNDHTRVLTRLFKKDIQKKSIDYFEIEDYEFFNNKVKIDFLKKIKKINISKYNKVFISSFEYIEEIKESLKNFKGIIFSPYDTSSRSICDYYFIKKYKGKIPMFSKTI